MNALNIFCSEVRSPRAAVNTAGSCVPIPSKRGEANASFQIKNNPNARIIRNIIGVIIHFVHIRLHGIVQCNVSQLILVYL